jgi:hypothetical protein
MRADFLVGRGVFFEGKKGSLEALFPAYKNKEAGGGK